jgi:hypothetical protein
MKYLFHLNTFNDIDHIAPVIWKILENGGYVDVIFLSEFDFKSDYRIIFLLEYDRFNVCKAGKNQQLRNKILFNHRLRKLALKISPFRVILEFVSIHIWKNVYLKNGNILSVIYEWGSPYRLNHYDAIMLGIPAIVLPHGFNIFINYDVNEHVSQIKKNTGNWPDFSERNVFDVYILQTERHRILSTVWKQDEDKVEAWGSARFYPEWSSINLRLCGAMTRDIQSDINKVVFFLPHWSYNVKIQEVISLLEKIKSLDHLYLFVKGHTRGTGSMSQDNMRKIGGYENVELNVLEHSPQLIDFCDIVINFGSSIAIDAVNIGVPIIHTPYLHTNTTIFDNSLVNYVANNDEEVIALIEKGRQGLLKLPTKKDRERFFHDEVYCGKNKFNVLDQYFFNIEHIIKS